jgi:hypothetical protein
MHSRVCSWARTPSLNSHGFFVAHFGICRRSFTILVHLLDSPSFSFISTKLLFNPHSSARPPQSPAASF